MYACYLIFKYILCLAVQLLEAIEHRTADGAWELVARPCFEVVAGDLFYDDKEEMEEKEEADEDSSDTSDHTSSPPSKEQIAEDVVR